MPAPRSTALEGAALLLDILHRIPRRSYITTSQLRAQLEAAGYLVSQRSLQRHLDVLMRHYPIECDTRSKPYGYRWMKESCGLSLPALTPAEALLLALAYQELSSMLPARILRGLASLLENARREIEAGASFVAERRWMKKVARIPDAQPLLPARIAPAVFDVISDALYFERELAIVYRNARGERREATVWPLGLVQQSGRGYLVCRFPRYQNERILALSRIERARMLGNTFPWPSGFDLERYVTEGHFGIQTERRVRVKFSIDAALGRHLMESPLSRDQTAREAGGRLEICATVPETLLLHRRRSTGRTQFRGSFLNDEAPAC